MAQKNTEQAPRPSAVPVDVEAGVSGLTLVLR